MVVPEGPRGVPRGSLEVPGGPRGVPGGSQGRPPGVPGASLGGPRRVPGGPRGVSGKPQEPGEDLFGHWGPFRGPVAICFPASKCPKTLKIFKTHKQIVKTGSKPLFGDPKP